jgi:hypothetical protein
VKLQTSYLLNTLFNSPVIYLSDLAANINRHATQVLGVFHKEMTVMSVCI